MTGIVPHGPERKLFARILCGVDGSAAGDEATRQAAVLLAPNGELALLAVSPGGPSALTTRPTQLIKRLGDALDRARRIASQHGATASVELAGEGATGEQLMRKSRGYQLLVVGSHERSRPAGIVRGSTASELIHRATVPVLLARTPPQGAQFPTQIVAATDGSAQARHALDIALRLAAEHHATIALMLASRDRDHEPDTLDALHRELFEHVTVERLLIDPNTAAHTAIVQAARTTNASLIIIGSRGLTGLRAVASVSERVAHEAPCSVLVMRPST